MNKYNITLIITHQLLHIHTHTYTHHEYYYYDYIYTMNTATDKMIVHTCIIMYSHIIYISAQV